MVCPGGDERDAVAEAEAFDEVADPAFLGGTVDAAGAADHGQAGVGPVEFDQGPHGDVDALERLDASGEQEERSGPEAEGGCWRTLTLGPRWRCNDVV